MSPNGTHPVKVLGSQLALNPGSELTNVAACATQPAGSPASPYAVAIEGLIPPGRKKFIRDASTKGNGPNAIPIPALLQPRTVNGLAGTGNSAGLFSNLAS